MLVLGSTCTESCGGANGGGPGVHRGGKFSQNSTDKSVAILVQVLTRKCCRPLRRLARPARAASSCAMAPARSLLLALGAPLLALARCPAHYQGTPPEGHLGRNQYALLNYSLLLVFRPLRAHSWPRDLSRSMGLVLLCRLHPTPASETSSGVVSLPKAKTICSVSCSDRC